MDSKEAFLAAKILVDFIRDFTRLSENQLLAIRKMMEVTVQDVMSNVATISNTADSKTNSTKVVLTKEGKDGEFNQTVISNSEEEASIGGSNEEAMDRRKKYLEGKLRRAGGVFSKHMEALSTMDTDIQNILAKVVGSVSMDDVMGQRLSHVIFSVKLLRRGIAQIVENFEFYQTQKNIKQIRNEILTEVYTSYTAEEEKEIFHKIFGQPKSNKKAS